MKLQIIQDDLQKAVSAASRFTSSKAQLPILGNILLTAGKTKLTIASTNLETSVSVSIGAKVEKEGEIAVPGRVLTDLIGNLPKETLTLEAEKEQLKVSSSSFASTVLGLSGVDFPKVPKSVGKDKSVEINFETLSSALSKVLFSVSIDETRPILTGVLFTFDTNELLLVSTDGFRLSQKKIKAQGLKSGKKFILPKAILSEIGRGSSEDDSVFIEFQETDKQAVFGVGEAIYSSRLIEGEFPDYEKIIPKSPTLTVRTDKEELARAVKLAGVFARDSSNIVKMSVKKDEVELSAESSQAGSQTTKIEAKTETNKKDVFEIAFNYRFIEEFIQTVGGEEIQMDFSEGDKAGVFTDTSDKDYLHLIMPVRVQS